jgi:hypothetical protein
MITTPNPAPNLNRLYAMELVGALGERHICVDTACIIQNSASDKQRQFSSMDSMVSFAWLEQP